MKQSEWFGCYSSSWNSAPLVPEAYSHPAKVSFGLAERIYKHMIDSGYLKIGDRVLDPFGGIAGFSFHAMMNGLHFYGVELEQRFVDLGQQNIDLWNKRYAGWFANWGTAVLRQGDSRYLAQVIGAGDGCVSSPPYANGEKGHPSLGAVSKDDWGIDGRDIAARRGVNGKYGDAPAQLANMPAGDFDAVVSSSPYGDAVQAGDGPGARWDEATHPNNPDKVSSQSEYGRTPGQLGNMRMDAAVSSAPFEANAQPRQELKGKNLQVRENPRHAGEKLYFTEYKPGTSEGQLGQETGATFWTAARDIVQQVHEVLKPGGYAAWVTGNFRRNGEVVDFGGQWLALCESCGFVGVEHIIAWKVERRGEQLDIFGNSHSKDISRVSFFRRLDNAKNPGQEIENEDIWIVQKPL